MPLPAPCVVSCTFRDRFRAARSCRSWSSHKRPRANIFGTTARTWPQRRFRLHFGLEARPYFFRALSISGKYPEPSASWRKRAPGGLTPWHHLADSLGPCQRGQNCVRGRLPLRLHSRQQVPSLIGNVRNLQGVGLRPETMSLKARSSKGPGFNNELPKSENAMLTPLAQSFPTPFTAAVWTTSLNISKSKVTPTICRRSEPC